MNDDSENISGTPEADPDWEGRRLCSDESCIGTIGPDGRCRICGLADTEAPGTAPPVSEGIDETRDSQDAFSVTPPESSDDAWENRRLCRDESCIGTIGPDGRCRICGLPES